MALSQCFSLSALLGGTDDHKKKELTRIPSTIVDDLDLFYQKQLVSSLQDSILQQRIDHEIRMRDGTARLLAASKQPQQLVEAAKNLLTSNTRMLAYMGELQRRKASVVLQGAPPEVELGNQIPCRGKIVLSDLRVPLMWKDSDHFKNKGDHRRYAVFCLVKVGTEVFDTQLLKCVDRTMTDLTFADIITFEDVGADFECTLEVYSHKLLNDLSMASTPKKIRRKMGELSTSIGRSVGRRLSGLKEDADFGAGALIGPRFECVAKTTMRARDITEHVSTHSMDLQQAEDTGAGLPLFGHFCCRLAGQPSCMLKDTASGTLLIKDLKTGKWASHHCTLRALTLSCWEKAEDSSHLPPCHTIPMSEDTQISEADPSKATRPHTVQLRHTTMGQPTVIHLVAAQTPTDHTYWWNAFQQHMLDKVMWGEACSHIMNLPTPPSRRHSSYAPVSALSSLPDSDSPMSRFLNRLNVDDEEDDLPSATRRQIRSLHIDPSLPTIPDVTTNADAPDHSSRKSSSSSLGSVSSLGSADSLSASSSVSSSVSETSLASRGSSKRSSGCEQLAASLNEKSSPLTANESENTECNNSSSNNVKKEDVPSVSNIPSEEATGNAPLLISQDKFSSSESVTHSVLDTDVVVALSFGHNTEDVEMVGTSIASLVAERTSPPLVSRALPVMSDDVDAYERDMEVLESLSDKQTSQPENTMNKDEISTESQMQIDETELKMEMNECNIKNEVSCKVPEQDIESEKVEHFDSDVSSLHEMPCVNKTHELPTACEATLVCVETASVKQVSDINPLIGEITASELMLSSVTMPDTQQNERPMTENDTKTVTSNQTAMTHGNDYLERTSPILPFSLVDDPEQKDIPEAVIKSESSNNMCDDNTESKLDVKTENSNSSENRDALVENVQSVSEAGEVNATPEYVADRDIIVNSSDKSKVNDVENILSDIVSAATSTASTTDVAEDPLCPETPLKPILQGSNNFPQTPNIADMDCLMPDVIPDTDTATTIDIIKQDFPGQETPLRQIPLENMELPVTPNIADMDRVPLEKVEDPGASTDVAEIVSPCPETPLRQIIGKDDLSSTPNIADMDCFIPENKVPVDTNTISSRPTSRCTSPGALSNSSASSGLSMETSV